MALLRHRTAVIVTGIVLAITIAAPAGVAQTGPSGGGTEAPTGTARYVIDDVSTREQRTAIARTGAAIEQIGADSVVVTATPSELRAIRAAGFGASVLAEAAGGAVDPGYHTHAEMVTEVNAVAAAHPDLVQVFSIGNSYQGRSLLVAKISDHVATDEAEPEVLFDALHHAREHLTVEMSLAILHWMVDGYGTDTRVTNIVNSREVFVMFMLNPDGGDYDMNTTNYRFWRKNRQPNAGGSVGTDLNRNYDYRWGCCGGSSGTPTSETYRGTAPFSAPEADLLHDFVDSRVVNGVQQIRSNISYHTYSQLVLWPYGYTFNNIPTDMIAADEAVFRTFGITMANTTCTGPDGCYTPQQSSDLYITDGTSIDWLYGVHRVFAWTFEMYPSGGDGFYPPASVAPAQTLRLKESVLQLLENSDCLYRTNLTHKQHCPIVKKFGPKRGAPGQTVTIQGKGFTGAVQVAFDGIPATSFTVVSDLMITAVVPAGVRTGNITVERARGTGTSIRIFTAL